MIGSFDTASNYSGGGAGGLASPCRGAGCPRNFSLFSRAAEGGVRGIPE